MKANQLQSHRGQQLDESLSNKDRASEMKLLMDIIRSVRNIRAEVNTPMSKEVPLYISTRDDETAEILETNRKYIERFCNPKPLTIGKGIAAPGKTMSAVITGAELFLPLEGLIEY